MFDKRRCSFYFVVFFIFARVEKKIAKNETTKGPHIDLHLTQPNYPTLGLS